MLNFYDITEKIFNFEHKKQVIEEFKIVLSKTAKIIILVLTFVVCLYFLFQSILMIENKVDPWKIGTTFIGVYICECTVYSLITYLSIKLKKNLVKSFINNSLFIVAAIETVIVSIIVLKNTVKIIKKIKFFSTTKLLEISECYIIITNILIIDIFKKLLSLFFWKE